MVKYNISSHYTLMKGRKIPMKIKINDLESFFLDDVLKRVKERKKAKKEKALNKKTKSN